MTWRRAWVTMLAALIVGFPLAFMIMENVDVEALTGRYCGTIVTDGFGDGPWSRPWVREECPIWVTLFREEGWPWMVEFVLTTVLAFLFVGAEEAFLAVRRHLRKPDITTG